MSAYRMQGPWRSLDEQEVAEARRRYEATGDDHWTADRLAARYGVSRRTIWRYLSNRPSPAKQRVIGIVNRWAHLYALDLRPQERDALIDMLCTPKDGAVSAIDRVEAVDQVAA